MKRYPYNHHTDRPYFEKTICLSVIPVLTFIVCFLFFFNASAISLSGAQRSLRQSLETGLEDILGSLKINKENLSANELRFLEISLERDPTWMLENKTARKAIFEGPSSNLDKAYRKLFYSRLDPDSSEEMSKFFDSFRIHQHSVYRRLGGQIVTPDMSAAVIPRQIRYGIIAWKRVTRGILYAINNGDFNISLSDFHALWANDVSEFLLKYPPFSRSTDKRLKLITLVSELLNVFQATSNPKSFTKRCGS